MQLIDRALNALEILSQNMNGMSVTDLAEQLGIPASSTHRILSSLKGNHFVVQDEHTKKYRLGYKICAIATGVVKGSALTQAAQMPMRRLAEKIDRNVVLCIMEHGAVMNVACSERGDSNMYMVKIGHEIPFYSTSAGRVFMAYMNRSEALDILDREKRTKTTPNTKTDLKELNEELDRIHNQGYAVIDEELQMGILGTACPVFDRNGELAAAIAFTSMKDGDTEKCSRGSVSLRNVRKKFPRQSDRKKEICYERV